MAELRKGATPVSCELRQAGKELLTRQKELSPIGESSFNYYHLFIFYIVIFVIIVYPLLLLYVYNKKTIYKFI